jgi:hypothetical protein
LAAAATVASFICQLDRDRGCCFFNSSASPRPFFHSFVSLTAGGTRSLFLSFLSLTAAALVSFIGQLDRSRCFFHSSACPRPFFLSFVSFTATAAVVSFIRQRDGRERAAEGGKWPMQ